MVYFYSKVTTYLPSPDDRKKIIFSIFVLQMRKVNSSDGALKAAFFLVQLLLILLGACHENMKAWFKGVLLIHVLIPLLSLSNIVQPTKQSNAHWFSLHFMISYTDSKAVTTLWNMTNNTTRHWKKVMLRRFFQENDAMLLRRLYP